MTITLTIDSVDSSPDGGPIRYQARNRGFEIGRQQHLDWTLPDPSRYISGLHCEVRFEKGGYWLYDVSRNGTFLNGSTARMKSPYRLQTRRPADDRQLHRRRRGRGRRGRAPSRAGAGCGRRSVAALFLNAFGRYLGDGRACAPPPIDRRELTPEPPGRRRAADFSNQFLEFPDMVPPRAPEPSPARRRSVRGARRRLFLPHPQSPFGAAPPRSRRRVRAPAYAPPVPVSAAGRSARAAWPGPCRSRANPFASGPPAAAVNPAAAVSPATPFAVQPFPPRVAAPSGDQQALRPVSAGPRRRGRGARLKLFATRDPGEVGYEVGEFLRVAVEHLAQLLRARAAAKAMTKSSSRTMIGATDNNPLEIYSRARPGDHRRHVHHAGVRGSSGPRPASTPASRT